MAKTKAVLKTKKKRWITLLAPKFFHEQPIGESLVYEPKNVVGKYVLVNLMTLTNDPKKQSINVQLIVNGLQGDRGTTDLVGYKMMTSSAKRLVRRVKSKIDMSFLVRTKDDKILRIKPVFIARSMAPRSMLSAMQRACYQYCLKTIAGLTLDALLSDLISTKFQRPMYDILNKIYPIQICEIREMLVLTGVKGIPERPGLVVPKVEITEAPRTEETSSEEPVAETAQ